MHNDLIILTQLTQHSSGSSPHRHLHTSCFHSIWLICFPTSFSVSLSLLSCCACPPLYFFPASHPASLCHLFAFKLLSTSLVILNLPVFLPFFFHLCPPFLPTLWHSQVAMLPFSSLFSQLLQSLGVPFLYQQDIVALVPTLVSPLHAVCVNCLSTVALFGTPDLQTLSLEGYRRGRQRMRWLDTTPGLNRHGFEKTLGDTRLAESERTTTHPYGAHL